MWADHQQVAVLKSAEGEIVFHFHARDLHLVLGPSMDGKPVRFRVTIGGHASGEDDGVDTDAAGSLMLRIRKEPCSLSSAIRSDCNLLI